MRTSKAAEAENKPTNVGQETPVRDRARRLASSPVDRSTSMLNTFQHCTLPHFHT